MPPSHNQLDWVKEGCGVKCCKVKGAGQSRTTSGGSSEGNLAVVIVTTWVVRTMTTNYELLLSTYLLGQASWKMLCIDSFGSHGNCMKLEVLLLLLLTFFPLHRKSGGVERFRNFLQGCWALNWQGQLQTQVCLPQSSGTKPQQLPPESCGDQCVLECCRKRPCREHPACSHPIPLVAGPSSAWQEMTGHSGPGTVSGAGWAVPLHFTTTWGL